MTVGYTLFTSNHVRWGQRGMVRGVELIPREPFQPELTIVIFIHYKSQFSTCIVDEDETAFNVIALVKLRGGGQ